MILTKLATRGLNSVLLKRGWKLVRTTDYAALRSFLRSVHPVTTEHALVRLGGDGDGGYVVPNDLEDIKACFSPGVSKVADFELELARRGIPCFLTDYSVDAAPVEHELFHFQKKYLGTREDEVFTCLEKWVTQSAPNAGDLLLQMDIEGSEYGVIFDTSSAVLRRFRIVVIEFHKLNLLMGPQGLELIGLAFGKLLKDFDVVHIHPNNWSEPEAYGPFEIPRLMEFTFLRKDRIRSRKPTASFPHPLDRVNVPAKPDYPLPDCWYK
jgi:hypothetical protein